MVEFFKGKKKMMIVGGIMAAAIAIGGISVSANAAITVNSYKADRGALSQVLEINGNVETDNSQTYYSEIDGKVGMVHVKEGDFVKKGDLLISYDSERLDYLASLEDLKAQSDLGSYNNSMQTGNRTAGLYGEAKRNLTVLDQQIADTQAAITQTQNDLLERRSALADEGAKLQISLVDWADKPDSDEYENLQKLVQSNAYEQQYASDIVQMQEELNRLNVQLAACKEYKAEMTSQKAATVNGLMTQGAKEQLEAVKASNEMINADKRQKYEEAKDGIRAEFDGVVKKIQVVEGGMVSEGMAMVVLDSVDDIVLRLSVNKYDIVNLEEDQPATVRIKNKDYTGKVSRIERMTGEDSTGIGVEVTLDEPDSDIILGLEAKVKITAASEENVLRIPMDAVSSDETGDYVFLLDNKKAVKQKVEIGIENDDMAEIISGIKDGDTVVWNDTQELEDGMDLKLN